MRMPLNKPSINKHKGSVAIEFAIILPILLFVVVTCFDLVRIMLLRVGLDHALAEASRQAKLTAASSSNFQQLLLTALKSKQIIGLKDAELSVSKIRFFASPAALAQGAGLASQGSLEAPLVSYQVQYNHKSLSPWLGKQDLTTEVVVKHEN